MAQYNIVCFCGGGIRGLLSATILENLYTTYPGILKYTDLFAGTSTGSGIISMILAGMLPSDIVTYFLGKELTFFQKPTGTGAGEPMYSVADAYAGQVEMHYKQELGLAPLSYYGQSVLFTAFNVGSNVGSTGSGGLATTYTPWAPILFSNLPGSPNSGTTLAEAVTSSSAMPGMLGSCNGNIDGAFVHHDPTLAAIAMALSSNPKLTLNDINVICIGTGFMANWIASDTSGWGAQQWQDGDGNQDSNTPALLLNGTVSPILNASLSGTSTNLVPMLAGMMLPQGQYAYLNPTLGYYIPENDTIPADITYLQDQAAECDPQQMATAEAMLGTYWVAH
ncbi:MAG TPA: patatin-like phospholipase family protein [Stellaceae bacterium]|jgi:hypothetical protein